MAQPYVGEVRMTAGFFAPLGWYYCDGRLWPISEDDSLYSVIGNRYGGDANAGSFAVPDLRGRVPLHQGLGFAATAAAGVEEVTLATTEMPSHTHAFNTTGVP